MSGKLRRGSRIGKYRLEQKLGEALGVPEDTARSRIRRGKELLREAIEKVASSAEVAESTAGDLDGWAAAVREGMG